MACDKPGYELFDPVKRIVIKITIIVTEPDNQYSNRMLICRWRTYKDPCCEVLKSSLLFTVECSSAGR